ncbi:hypothetical protein SFRA_029055 [Streptomyces xinghaiensis]|uniref:Uncharacterized protein n=1 Tax=Streptomyces xinghaiensis TaxID=1038928 RepID=A0A3R7F4Y1_9ACTN|nr:hypothetical protein SFRA_029055 [Streptomyces xinghaiensis]RNC69671.1 hypothetical protein DC095_028140 [Streptomyces xinghaiensis]
MRTGTGTRAQREPGHGHTPGPGSGTAPAPRVTPALRASPRRPGTPAPGLPRDVRFTEPAPSALHPRPSAACSPPAGLPGGTA